MIPENVSRFRPGPCTEIKHVNGNWYVYMYEAVLLKSGKWGKKTGACIGKIIPDVAFIPNRNYHLYTGEQSKDDITLLEYGQYALIEAVGADVRDALEKCFDLETARQIFCYGAIFLANGFVHKDQVNSYFEQGWFSLEYRNFSFRMGRTALNTLLDKLGRRTTRVVEYQNNAIKASERIAIDGHAIRSSSDENDLGEAGYKFSALNDDQVNLLMGYDVTTMTPLFSRMFRGSCNDKAAVKDLFDILTISGILLMMDRGFYSEGNLKLFKKNGNTYIIPVPSNTNVFKKAMADVKYTDEFCYVNGKKHARIEYMTVKISEDDNVYVFRDIDENSATIFNYNRCIDKGKSGYTKEKLEEQKENFGVYVLQSNSKLSAKEVFCAYKSRWGIETFYQYVRNVGDFNDLKEQNYVREQGLAFIILITGQLYSRLNAAVKRLNDTTTSVADILQMARCLKLDRKGNSWICRNKKSPELATLAKVGFTPLDVYVEQVGA
jgi:hypothetical protein